MLSQQDGRQHLIERRLPFLVPLPLLQEQDHPGEHSTPIYTVDGC